MKQEKKSNHATFLLRSLRLFGLNHLDTVILAALADKRPLLLIGPHGTAKSEMLNRLAKVLHLKHRHYNASLLSFDDLLGYPVLDAAGKKLEFVETEASVWGAESLFFDEISRCRPETANKLFSLIHESRVQGIFLSSVKYRWSAMNPPVSEDNLDKNNDVYVGSLPLDPALADRFSWVVQVPTISEISLTARKELITNGGSEKYTAPHLIQLIEKAQRAKKAISESEQAWVIDWVTALLEALRESKITLSGRRCIFLRDSVLWLHAASVALNRPLSLEKAAFEALQSSLPHPAQGITVDRSVLRGAHRKACEIAGTPIDSLVRNINATQNPVKRIALALTLPHNPSNKIVASEIVAEALSSLPEAHRKMLSIILSRHSETELLNAQTLEIITDPIINLMAFSEKTSHKVSKIRSQASLWNSILETVSQLEREKDRDRAIVSNMLMQLFATNTEISDVSTLVGKFKSWREMFEPIKEDVVQYEVAYEVV